MYFVCNGAHRSTGRQFNVSEVNKVKEILLFLVLFPLVTALLLQLFRGDAARGFIVRASALVIATASVTATCIGFAGQTAIHIEAEWLKWLFLAGDLAIACFIAATAVKAKKPFAVLLAVIQIPLALVHEFIAGHGTEDAATVVVDKFSLIMVLIIGIIGSLIAVYTISYLRDYHHHHHDVKDRRPMFFGVMFAFLSAMFGLVLANDLGIMFFFWEVTTLSSFLLIGYTGSTEAVNNAFRAVVMNLSGGIAFAIALIWMDVHLGSVAMSDLLKAGAGNATMLVPVVLLAYAGITKAAQMPFSSWLLGAMVAPTPSSALLHSSTMVKAGVYLLIRLAPLLGSNIAGFMVMLVGGITFLIGSLAAITQTDAKKVLAWSTIANLGLIVTCGGVGTYESVWAGILLIIFHAIAKSLLFLSVGTVEHGLGSRDIEDMHGLIIKMPTMAILMTIGIAGMFLAPFGMLISKWAALRAFIDSKNVLIVMALVYGSAATLFYWTKWLGKLMAVLGRSERLKHEISRDERFSLTSHAVLAVAMCFLFPVVSSTMIEPFLISTWGPNLRAILTSGNLHIMSMMLGVVLLMPLAMYFIAHAQEEKIVTAYMAGVNRGDNRTFVDSFGRTKQMYLTNWYMDKAFNEKRLSLIGVAASAATIAVVVFLIVGGVFA